MKNTFTSLFKILSIIFLMVHSLSPIRLQAQNPTDPDTTFGLGTFNALVRDVKIQLDGKILVGGYFTYHKTTPLNRIARLNQDGSLDNTFNTGTGANNYVLSIAIQPDGKILLGGGFTSFNGAAKNHLVRLNTDGSVDTTFNIGSGTNNDVWTVVLQPDGKILAGGFFTSFNGTAINNFVRLNTDGSVDNTFNSTGAIFSINSIALQPDGKILVGGDFTSFNGASVNSLVRLNTNGSVDNTFNIGTGAIRGTINGTIYSIVLQPDGKILAGGYFTSFNGAAKNYLVRLNTDGSVDNTFNIGTGASYSIYSIALQPDGKIIAGGDFSNFNGASVNTLVRLNTDGSVDNSFNVGTGASFGTSNGIWSIALQTDGKIIAGGGFTSFNGTVKNYLVRLSTDGSLDNTFNIGKGGDDDVWSIALQPDGKILVGGSFTCFNGAAITGLVRLNTDGSVDNTFNIGTGANYDVYSIALQPDGKILAAGVFTIFNGTVINCLVRLNTDGSVDNTFNIGTGFNSGIYSVAIQPDGKILAGGYFTSFNGAAKNYLVRLNSDGSVDNTFNIGTAVNDFIYSIALQPDGKILASGRFTSFNGAAINRLVRLNTDGSVDNTFSIGTGANSHIWSIVLQPDGKILAGGYFTSFNGAVKNYLVRLNTNGSLDKTFIGTGANSAVSSIAFQSDGKILVGGGFTSFNGAAKNRLVRLNTDGSLDNTFNIGVGANSNVLSIALQSDGKILAGGYFNGFNGTFNYIVRLHGDPIYYNTVRGNIYTDANNDCNFQISETRLPSVIIKALPGPYYGGSDAYGNYQLRVDSGTVAYTLSQQLNYINSKLIVNQCASSQNISLTDASKDTCCFNFADSIKQCSLLNISIQKTRARRCFRNSTYVNYSNYGNSPATGAQIKIEYPSDFIPISSAPLWSSRQGSVLTYNIGTVQGGEEGQIIITDSVSCIAGITWLTECINASISPASNCTTVDPAWDKSSMKVTGSCQSGSAHFVITNDGAGDMGNSLEYRVYENDTLIYTGTYQLNSGENFTVDYPAYGQTIRLEADQSQYHPGNSHPRATVENCGIASPAVRNLVSTAQQDDLDEERAITCLAIRDSYDPNLKEAMPSGIGAAHNVVPGQEIEYVIHFQNTGNDTAYTVTVIDTLDAGHDMASFTQGASSHPYTLGISGKGQAVLSFRFDQINLPDSTTNNLESSGLVSYRMTVPSNASTGTIIKNKAYIYFDYNAPVITNETMHTVDNYVASNTNLGSLVQVGAVVTGLTGKKFIQGTKIYPNPTAGMITVEIPETGSNSELRILSTVGALQKSVALSNAIQQVSLEGLSQGLYLYEVWQNGERKTGGKLQVWF